MGNQEWYVITFTKWNKEMSEYETEKRYVPENDLFKAKDRSITEAKEYMAQTGRNVWMDLNKAYVCYYGYLVTGDYVQELIPR